MGQLCRFRRSQPPQREGYRTGTVSLRNIAFNPNGEPASIQRSTPFTLNSASLTAAFVDGLQVRIQGFVGGSAAYDNTYTLKVAAPALFQLNYAGVDRVTFTASPESQFVMDDLIVNVAVTNVPCAFALSAADGIHSGASQTGSVSVATSPGCAWTDQTRTHGFPFSHRSTTPTAERSPTRSKRIRPDSRAAALSKSPNSILPSGSLEFR